MSKESEEASGFFAKATDILRATPTPAPTTIDPNLGRAKARSIRAMAEALCAALEGSAPLGSIDEKAKTLGMEVLGVQQMTLQARKRIDK